MLQAFLAALPRDTSAFTITRVYCNCRHAVDKLNHSWNPGKNFPVLFKLNFPLLQPHKLHSGKYFLKISKPQQVQSLNYMYYSKNRGKLIDSIMGPVFHTIHFLDCSYYHSIPPWNHCINIVYFLSLHDVEIEFPSNLERVTFSWKFFQEGKFSAGEWFR